jgi:hypothetical protein
MPIRKTPMKDTPEDPQTAGTPAQAPGRKPQFTIGKMLLWTATGGAVVRREFNTWSGRAFDS